MHEAAAKVGAKDVALYKLPDNRLDTVPLLDVVKLVEDLIQKFQPEVIYTHHAGDLNVDHGVVQRAVLTATRPLAGQSVREIYAFEVPSSTEWAFQQLQPVFRPNVFVDVSRYSRSQDRRPGLLRQRDPQVSPSALAGSLAGACGALGFGGRMPGRRSF